MTAARGDLSPVHVDPPHGRGRREARRVRASSLSGGSASPRAAHVRRLRHCRSITMATLDRLGRATRARLGPNPALADRVRRIRRTRRDRVSGVSPATQAAVRGTGSATRVSRREGRDAHPLACPRRSQPVGVAERILHEARYREARGAGRFRCRSRRCRRSGRLTLVWGQVRPHSGERPYRLQRYRRRSLAVARHDAPDERARVLLPARPPRGRGQSSVSGRSATTGSATRSSCADGVCARTCRGTCVLVEHTFP